MHQFSVYRLVIFPLLFVFACMAIFNSTIGQNIIFTPTPDDVALLKNLSINVEKNYQQTLSGLPSKNKKEYGEIYKLRWENINEKFEEKEIYTSPRAQAYLDSIVTEIVASNPKLKGKDFNCFFSKSGVPNASYLGEGVIIFQMGLFEKLENESQVAFVLCHELAHFYLRHIENSINKYVSTMTSDEVQRELKEIQRATYNKRAPLEKLLKGLTFNSRRHSRDHESEADSLALIFLSNTRFDANEAISTLAILDKIDIDTFKVAVCLTKTLNSPGYPFKDKWLKKEEGLLGGHAIIKEEDNIEDSLKTHPDCKARITKLQSALKSMPTHTNKNVISKTTFDELRNLFRYEVVQYAFSDGDYTKSLYYTLELLQAHPSDPYLVSQVGNILNACYKAQKAHKLSKFIALPNPGYGSNYNLLLQFIQNLYLEDYAAISYHYLQQFHPQLEKYEPFNVAYRESILITKE